MADRVDPYRNFRFRVEIDGISVAAFAEVTIPDSNTDPVDYREGTDPTHVKKLSGLTKWGNVTLKKGLSSSLDLYNWKKKVESKGAMGARKNVSIILIDEAGDDKARWNMVEAWPIKYDASDLNAKNNEVVIESIELVNEGITRVS